MSLALALKQAYLTHSPEEAAKSLEHLSETELASELAGLPPGNLLPVLDLLTTSRVLIVFRHLNATQRTGVLASASPRLAVLLLAAQDDEDREDLIASLPAAVAKELQRLLQFPENTAGRLMDRPFEVRADMSIEQAIERISGSNINRARSIYAVDHENRVAGRIDMQDLAIADRTRPLRDFLHELDGAVPPTAQREEVVEFLTRYQLDSVPVVDMDGRLMGVVRYQRLFETIENVATADLQKMVGVSADERSLSTPGFSIRRRLPWLHINLLTAFLAAAVVGLFENLIAQFTALAILLPVVAGQSGNAGSQALAVTIRGLALREIGTREWRHVLSKELMVGVVNGSALAITCGLGVLLWSDSAGLALVIAVAMVLSMVAAGFAGALVPIVLTRIGQDPATASSIILTTVTDIAGFFAFLGTATLLSFML